MDTYPEDFNRSSPILHQLMALQQAMSLAQDEELIELVSSDGL